MAKKIRDLAVKVGSYTDRNSGQEKARWESVGALMQNDEDQSYFIMLKKTFNPAGVSGQDGRESILISAFIPQDQRETHQSSQQNPSRQSEQSYAQQSGVHGSGFDDPNIPF